MWLLALRKLYEAEQLEHTAVIDTFLQNTVGVADHDNILKVLKKHFDGLVICKSALAELDKLSEKANNEKEKIKDSCATLMRGNCQVSKYIILTFLREDNLV